MKRSLILQISSALVAVMAHAAPNFDLAAKATNDFAAELYRQLATGEQNLCVSPYSIETALAMTFAGADGETHDKIRDIIPADALNKLTRLVLANALYLKAPWADPFSDKATHPEPFHVRGGTPLNVPMVRKTERFGYARHEGFTAVSLPYVGG